jgi:hypothetical protein
LRLKTLIPIILNVVLVLVLVVIGCAQVAKSTPTATTSKPATSTTPSPTPLATSTPTTTPTPQVVTKDKTYNVLNPVASFQPTMLYPLAPRLDTFDGKTIWFIQTEADPVILPVLWDRLQKEYPKTTWQRTISNVPSPAKMTADQQKTAQAAISGIGW